MYPSLIGLYSPTMQSGKSEVARCLVEEHGYTRLRFAGPLKDMLRVLLRSMGNDFHTSERMVEGDLKEMPLLGLAGATPRTIMQTLGTDWGRDTIQDDIWIECARRTSDAIIRNGGRVVIDDLRFPNEYAFVTGWYSGEAWRIDRPGAVQSGTDHPSEALLEDKNFDCRIANDASVDDLWDSVAGAFECS